MKIPVHCDAGSDRNCFGTVEIDLPFIGLADQDISISWTNDNRKPTVQSISISPTGQNWANQNMDFLSQFDIDSLNSDGCFEVEYSRLQHKVCGACGSDQTYDVDGNNVSGR